MITTASTGASREIMGREKRYAITMAVRMACFLSMIFATGPIRWVLLAGAVFLPYIAVVLANQANTKTVVAIVPQAEPVAAPALTTGPPPSEVITGDVIEGDAYEDEADPWAQDRVA